MAESSLKGSFNHVAWKAGDYVRVWNKSDGKHLRSSGLCFVMATGQIGKFSSNTFDLVALE
jgi:hypothetical protein